MAAKNRFEDAIRNGRASHGDSVLVASGPLSKVDRYKWASLDAQGEQSLVDKHVLRVDTVNYQRDAEERRSLAKVRAIASDFSWEAFGILVVARRPDGSLYVVDGGHRLAAAMRRADVKKVPCVIFDVDSVEEEARAFLRLNTLRKPMDGDDKFKAQVALNYGPAVAVEKLVRQFNYSITRGGKGRSVRCLRVLVLSCEKDQGALEAIFPIVAEITGDTPITERLTCSLHYLECKMREIGDTLTSKKWKDRLVRIGKDELLRSMGSMCAFYGKGGEKVWARGVVIALNRGLREKGRINIPGLES